MNNLIDGKKVASEIKNEITQKISYSISKGNRVPSIKIILVGDHGPSKICLLYTSPSPRDLSTSRMPSSA